MAILIEMVSKKRKSFLLINPWIVDFAAYDLWARPLGLLYLASLLREEGHSVAIINCLDYSAPKGNGISKTYPAKRRQYGTGKYLRTPIEKPGSLRDIPRQYCRYGISHEDFREKLLGISRPDFVLITSLMTYWYPGVREAATITKELFPDTPVILGGSYVRLCSTHASRLPGIDLRFSGNLDNFPAFLQTNFSLGIQNPSLWKSIESYPYPAFDLWEPKPLDAVTLLTSTGCPFRCPYCASGSLCPEFHQRSPIKVVSEITHWHDTFGVKDFAFYDDALLVNSKNHIIPILEKILHLRLNVRFHTPNAVHVRELTPDLCELLKASGFTTLRLGLETADATRQAQKDNKVKKGEFPWAMRNLRHAGFSRSQIGVYLLCGLPGQNPSEVEYSIEVVTDLGASPFLAEYSPIPGTPLWDEACRNSPYPIKDEPLFHNNTLFPCQSERFPLSEFERLKQLAREARR